jgi:hypothetical protein
LPEQCDRALQADDYKVTAPQLPETALADDGARIGSLAPIIDGAIGCVVIKADRSRYLARVERDPLAEQ